MELIEGLNIDSLARIVWVSKEARDTWRKPIAEIGHMLGELEVLSVAHDQRMLSWQTIGEKAFPKMAMKWAKMGMLAVPLLRVGQFEGFAHKHAPLLPGQPANVCVIISKKIEHIEAFRNAYEKGDNVEQGRLLGYPKCCCDFFSEQWKLGNYDPIFQAAGNTEGSIKEVLPNGTRRVELVGHPYSNSALRYSSLRVGFHISHSFDCVETVSIAKKRMNLAQKIYPDSAKLLDALLRMPMSWDAYHGIAVIKTPIFYIITSSIPTKEHHLVEVDYGADNFIPREAAKGLCFPFVTNKDD